MDWGPMRVTTVDLGYEQMLMIESHPKSRVKVIYGGVWLTEEGVLQDAWLANGDEVALRSRGTALLESLGAARVQILRSVEAPSRRRVQAIEWGNRLLRWTRELRIRLHLGPRPNAVG